MWLYDVSMQHDVFMRRPQWSDNYWVHTRVMRLFGNIDGQTDVRHRAGILYRVEPNVGKGRVLVQSQLSTVYHDIRSVDLTSKLRYLRPNQGIGLRVKVNAIRTINRTNNGVKRTYREPLAPETVEPWFINIFSGALTNMEISKIEFDIECQRSVPIAVATIDARGVIENTEELTKLVATGIGRAKAFGCGLISVRRIASVSQLGFENH
jgi:CRISPR system Cascade subunit CasE